jgi:hypothetical protein
LESGTEFYYYTSCRKKVVKELNDQGCSRGHTRSYGV